MRKRKLKIPSFLIAASFIVSTLIPNSISTNLGIVSKANAESFASDVTTQSTLQGSQINQASSTIQKEGVYLYHSENFTGDFLYFPTIGNTESLDISSNDMASSIKIIGDFQIEVFEDFYFGGNKINIKQNIAALKSINFDNTLSSFKITKKPVKIFILAGESNMVDWGAVYPLPNSPTRKTGTLDDLTRTNPKYSNYLGKETKWFVRNDVLFKDARRMGSWNENTLEVNEEEMMKPALDYTVRESEGFSIATSFGLNMGEYCDEKVLILRVATGGKNLFYDFRPPSSPTLTNPAIDPFYVGAEYKAIVKCAQSAVANISSIVPDYNGQGYELSGFVFKQGWNDIFIPESTPAIYEQNLVNLIKSLRQDLNTPKLPVVILANGQGGYKMSPECAGIMRAQLNVDGNSGKYPEFLNNVLAIDTRRSYKEESISPEDMAYHYNRNCETLALMGEDAYLGIVKLLNEQNKLTLPIQPRVIPTNISKPSQLPFGDRNTFLVTMPMNKDTSWYELAYLAAIPAGMKINANNPSVIAITPSTKVPKFSIFGLKIGTKLQLPDPTHYYNYLDRYKPNYIYNIGPTTGIKNETQISSVSLDKVTVELARFWETSDTAVMVNSNDYKLSLCASTLAARLKKPLFFYNNTTISNEVKGCLKYLRVRNVVTLGANSTIKSILNAETIEVDSINNELEVTPWLIKNGYKVEYFAVCNSADRSYGYAPKSSLSAALLASSRNGVVTPLSYPDAVFNNGLVTQNSTTIRPNGAADSAGGEWRYGTFKINQINYNIVLSRKWSDFEYNQCNIDLNQDGDYSDPGEFIKRGETRNFNGKDFLVDVDTRRLTPNSLVKHYTDVRFTYPSSYQIKNDITSYVKTLNHSPKYMVMVGLADVLPFGLYIDSDGQNVTHHTDQYYADLDNDATYEVGMGRFVAENASISTLAASRAVTYDSLLNTEWQNNAVSYGGFETEVKSHYDFLSLNGFNASLIPDYKNVDKSKFNVAVHDDHGWPFGFGPYDEGISSPVFAMTGGCSMGNTIDIIPLNGKLSEYKDFGAVKFTRTGGIGFYAFSKNATADFEYGMRWFLSSILQNNSTMGEAQAYAANLAKARFGIDSENTTAPTFYGDPGLKIYTPE